ncbi:MAG: ATP-binding cassette domain-containing protein [Pseudomonadota bacterium]
MTLTLGKASVIRGGKAILNEAAFACAPGRFTALCGPNGAGKTTALSVLSGALKADKGRALLDAHNVRAFASADLARRRAVVSQISMLTFPFEAHEVVAMGRAPHFGISSPARDQEIISEAIQLMDLTPLAERRFTTLSGGERQRVHIARALAQVWEPPGDNAARWLLLDEPTAALDLKYQLALMRLLRRLAGEEGWGIVAVLHDLHLVKTYTDDTVLFRDGKIAALGETQAVLTKESVQDVFDLAEPYDIG